MEEVEVAEEVGGSRELVGVEAVAVEGEEEVVEGVEGGATREEVTAGERGEVSDTE